MEIINPQTVILKAHNLIQRVVDKYDIKNYGDFQCPFMKELAQSLKFFESKS